MILFIFEEIQKCKAAKPRRSTLPPHKRHDPRHPKSSFLKATLLFYPVPNYVVKLLMQWRSCRFIACTWISSASPHPLLLSYPVQPCALGTHEEPPGTHPTTVLKTSSDGTGGTASLLPPGSLFSGCRCSSQTPTVILAASLTSLFHAEHTR